MDDSAVDAYMNAKAEHEKAERKKEIEDAVSGIKTDLEKKVSDAEKKAEDAVEQLNGLKEKSDKDADSKQGSFVKFVKDNIKANPNAETEKNYSAETTIKAAALMTTANVIPNVTGGFSPLFGNYIDPEIGHIPKPETIFMDLVTVKTAPGTESIWYTDRINEEGDAEFIAEGALKPLADAEWKTVKKDVKEVALRWKMSKRLINHAPSVVTDFAEHANELVEQKIDDKILDGVESSTEFDGLIESASAFVVPSGLAGYYDFANIYDVIMAMATQIRLANFKGKITAVLNTVWMAKMAGVKDAEGRYLIPPFVTPNGKNVGEVEVKVTNKMDADDILVGDLKKFNLVMAEDVAYFEGYENDDFSKNLESKKLEAFAGTYIKASDSGSIVYDQISSVLTDIENPGV